VNDRIRQGTKIVTSTLSETGKDSLIVHCLSRAVIAANGWEKSEEQAKAGTLKVNQWIGARVAPKATRVALFIGSWAAAMRAEGRDEYTITEYMRYWNESERRAFRLQKEFRELWPEFGKNGTPNELALQIIKQGALTLEQDKKGKPRPFPVSVQVRAKVF
jgi:hypothetical protein